MREELMKEILALSVDERIQLVHDVWDSVAHETPLELTDEEFAELERRRKRFDTHPHEASPWHEVKERIKRAL